MACRCRLECVVPGFGRRSGVVECRVRLVRVVLDPDLLDEIERVLVRERGLSTTKAATYVGHVASTFPDGEIARSIYHDLIDQLSGPDPDDLVHLAAVIAVASRCSSPTT